MRPSMLRVFAVLLVAAPVLAGAETLPAPSFSGVVLWQSGQGPDAVAVRGAVDPLSRRGRLGADTPLHIGSITKLFTAVLVMQLVAEGRLTLDAPIAGFLPELPAAAGAVTVRQLLQHQSGLPEWNAESVELQGQTTAVPAIPSEALGAKALLAAAMTPRAAPGSGFFYNNLDYLLLAVVLERLSGKPYATLLDEQLLKPLRLGHTALATLPAHGRLQARVAPAATVDHGVLMAPLATPLANYGAAGALISTAADLSRFAAALLDGRLLPPEQRDQLFAEGLSVWGYGFADAHLAGQVPAVERQGAVGSYRSTLVLLPAQRGWLIVLANSDGEDYSTWIDGSFTHRLLAAVLGGTAVQTALRTALESGPVKPAAAP